MRPRYDSEGADCAAAMTAYDESRASQPVTLTGREAETLRRALIDSIAALERAENETKIFRTRQALRDLRIRVIAAEAHLSGAAARGRGGTG